MDLCEFLLARIAEDEAEARTARERNLPFWVAQEMGRSGGSLGVDYVNRFSPGRVLADCEAKRGVVVLYRLAMQHKTEESSEMVRLFAEQSCEDLFDALRILALPYANHADFRNEWRVYATT